MPNTQTSVPAFTSGQVLTAAQMTEVNTGIPVFATTTTRDAAFGGTGEKTLAEGQFAYIEASNTTQYYDGAAWQTVGSGLTLIKTQTIGSAVSSVTVSDVFSSTYDNYKVIITGSTTSSATGCNLTLQFGSTTSSDYLWTATVSDFNSASVSNYRSYPATSILVGGDYVHTQAHFDVYSPFLSRETNVSVNWLRYANSNNMGIIMGKLALTTSYTAFTVTTSTGTMTGGTIRVYGYQNS